jgi:hypothetical protein
MAASHPGQTIIGDKDCFGHAFEADLTERELTLLRPVPKGEAHRAGQELFKPLALLALHISPGYPTRSPRAHHRGAHVRQQLSRGLSRYVPPGLAGAS